SVLGACSSLPRCPRRTGSPPTWYGPWTLPGSRSPASRCAARPWTTSSSRSPDMGHTGASPPRRAAVRPASTWPAGTRTTEPAWTAPAPRREARQHDQRNIPLTARTLAGAALDRHRLARADLAQPGPDRAAAGETDGRAGAAGDGRAAVRVRRRHRAAGRGELPRVADRRNVGHGCRGQRAGHGARHGGRPERGDHRPVPLAADVPRRGPYRPHLLRPADPDDRGAGGRRH